MESALGFMHAYLQGALVGLPLPVRMGSETMGIYPLGAFETGSGEYCLVQVSNDYQWRRFCDLLGAAFTGGLFVKALDILYQEFRAGPNVRARPSGLSTIIWTRF